MIYRFEDFELDEQQLELRKDGTPRKLEPLTFSLLTYLVENHNRVVTKDDINKDVWDGRIVSEAALSSAIHAARAALEDDGKSQRLIKTIHGKGFRFIGDIKTKSSQQKTLKDENSIAVLPFDNMSTDPDQIHFCDGLCEDIITALSKVSGLLVIARNSSFTYKGRTVDIRQVGNELGVKYVLEGSVRRSGNRLRVTGQLINAGTGAHVWAHKYDRDINDIFALQDELTRQIILSLQVKIVDGEQARWWASGTKNFEAWELARDAHQLMGSQHKAKVLKARKLVSQALELDPLYAGAHVVKAQSYYAEVYDGWSENVRQALKSAQGFLDTALEISPKDPHALIVSAMILTSSQKHEQAFDLSQVASKLAPSDALVVNFSAAIAFYSGNYSEAERLCKRAIKLSPMSKGTSLGLLASIYVIDEKYETAIEVAEVLTLTSKNYIYGPVALAASYSALEDDKAAKAAAETILELDPDFRVSAFLDSKPFQDSTATLGMRDALLKAGLPA